MNPDTGQIVQMPPEEARKKGFLPIPDHMLPLLRQMTPQQRVAWGRGVQLQRDKELREQLAVIQSTHPSALASKATRKRRRRARKGKG
jgi:uracil DNA glycosylase